HILVVATEDGQLRATGIADCVARLEAATTRREQQDRWRRAQRLDGLEERVGLHDHAWSATIWIIVDGAMPVVGMIAQVDDLIDQASRGGSARWYGERERRRKEFRKDRDDADEEHGK